MRDRHSSPVALALVPSEFPERAARQRSDGPKAVRSCRQTSAALLATRSDDSSATACAHATPKPVLLGSFPNIGLIRAFHNSSRPHGPKPHGDNECLGIGYPDTEGGHRALQGITLRLRTCSTNTRGRRSKAVCVTGRARCADSHQTTFMAFHVSSVSFATEKTPLNRGFASFLGRDLRTDFLLLCSPL